MYKQKTGFTLIELVIVIAILGILASIAIPRFLDAQATARGSKIVADMRTMESALTLYTIDNSITKSGETDPSILVTGTRKYLTAIPTIPTGTAKFPNGVEYNLTNTNSSYKIYHHSAKGLTFIALKFGAADLPISHFTDKTDQ